MNSPYKKVKVIRSSTVPESLNGLLKGQLRFLNSHFEVIAVSGDGANLDEVEKREGVRTIPVKMERRISLINDLRSFFNLYHVFRKEKPLIVHSITPKAGLLSMAAAYFAGVPIRMHTFTGLVFPSRTGFMHRLLIGMDKLLCRFATNIYPEGQGVKNDLVNFKITNKHLEVLANGNVNGVDLDFFKPDNFTKDQNDELRSSLGVLKEDLLFIFVGRLVGDKGVNELVAGFKKCNAKFPNIKLLLVGPREDDLDPLELATLQEIDRNEAIITVGFVVDVRSYLAISDILILPSHREGFPNVVLQGGAMGLPCIVTDISGSNEIITPMENGLVIKVKDETAIANAMQQLIENPEMRDSMRKNARGRIVERYAQEDVWNAVLSEYKREIKNV